MKHNYRSLALFLVLYLALESPARAEFSYGPFSLSAFGTLGGAWLSNDHVNYYQGTQPTGPGITHDFDLGIDSRLGAQLNIALGQSTLVTAQTVVERLSDNEFQPRLTQANIRQEIGDHFFARVGRIQSPLFLASDYRLANFSNPWVRTPGVLYNIYPLTHLDSAEMTYRQDTALGQISLNAGYGWLKYPFPTNSDSSSPGGGRETTDLELDDVVYANLKLDDGPWRFKLSWLHARISAQLQEFDQILAGLAFLDPYAANALDFNHNGVALYSAGFTYDGDDWLVMSEWGIARSDQATAFSDKHGGYFTVGYHIDRWMPQMTLGYQATTDRRVHSANPVVDSFISSLHQLQRTDYRTLGLGLNYAVTDSVIVRGQVDLIEPMNNSKGPYLKTDAHYNFKDPGIDALLSFSLDFVY